MNKEDKELVLDSLGVSGPWDIEEDHYDTSSKTRQVMLVCTDTTGYTHTCPKCAQSCVFYDLRAPRQWRHLDTGTYRTILHARMLRISCLEHGILTMPVPWAFRNSRFTFGFEKVAFGYAQATNILTAAKKMGVGWGAMAGIMERAMMHQEPDPYIWKTG